LKFALSPKVIHPAAAATIKCNYFKACR